MTFEVMFATVNACYDGQEYPYCNAISVSCFHGLVPHAVPEDQKAKGGSVKLP
jgi:hypothetical protein